MSFVFFFGYIVGFDQSANDGRVAGAAMRALGALCAVAVDATSSAAALDTIAHVVTPAAAATPVSSPTARR